MLRSMTGFGRAFLKSKKGCFEIELQSVNRRFLESTVFLPREFSSLETEIKKIISQKVFRGQLIFRLNFYPSEGNLEAFLPNIVLLKGLKKRWEEIIKELKLKKEEININFLAQQLKMLPKAEGMKDLTEEKKLIFRCLDKALKELIKMKEKEGESLTKNIKKHLEHIEKIFSKIKEKSKNSSEIYQKKLKDRLSDFLSKDLQTDERILREIVIFSEKVDITEELVRTQSHLQQFFTLLEKEELAGRKMDFLLQEMIREVNTITSKSFDKDISSDVVNIKSSLEKIKEQIQNIE